MQLNNSPPVGAFFLGWDANPIKIGEKVSVIHHYFDSKNISLDVVDSYRDNYGELSASFISTQYTSSSTETGSLGAGLLTEANGSYAFRGGLVGGSASCFNSGGPVSTGNYDYYSRFDQIFPALRPYLFKEAIGPNYTDMWWGGESESGWGIQIAQHRSNNFLRRGIPTTNREISFSL